MLKYLALALVPSVSFVPRAHAGLECFVVNEYTQLFRCEDDAKGTFTVDGWKHSPAGFAMEGNASPDHSAHLYRCLDVIPPERTKYGEYQEAHRQIEITVTYTSGGHSKTDAAYIVCSSTQRKMLQPL